MRASKKSIQYVFHASNWRRRGKYPKLGDNENTASAEVKTMEIEDEFGIDWLTGEYTNKKIKMRQQMERREI